MFEDLQAMALKIKAETELSTQREFHEPYVPSETLIVEDVTLNTCNGCECGREALLVTDHSVKPDDPSILLDIQGKKTYLQSGTSLEDVRQAYQDCEGPERISRWFKDERCAALGQLAAGRRKKFIK